MIATYFEDHNSRIPAMVLGGLLLSIAAVFKFLERVIEGQWSADADESKIMPQEG